MSHSTLFLLILKSQVKKLQILISKLIFFSKILKFKLEKIRES